MFARPVLELLELSADCLAAAGLNPDLVKEARAACSQTRKKHAAAGRAARGKSGRKPQPLPWDQIDPLRVDGLSWQEITDRLEAAGYPITRQALAYRNRQRLKLRVTVTVTRG